MPKYRIFHMNLGAQFKSFLVLRKDKKRTFSGWHQGENQAAIFKTMSDAEDTMTRLSLTSPTFQIEMVPGSEETKVKRYKRTLDL
jgi:hypothetical protein